MGVITYTHPRRGSRNQQDGEELGPSQSRAARLSSKGRATLIELEGHTGLSCPPCDSCPSGPPGFSPLHQAISIAAPISEGHDCQLTALTHSAPGAPPLWGGPCHGAPLLSLGVVWTSPTCYSVRDPDFGTGIFPETTGITKFEAPQVSGLLPGAPCLCQSQLGTYQGSRSDHGDGSAEWLQLATRDSPSRGRRVEIRESVGAVIMQTPTGTFRGSHPLGQGKGLFLGRSPPHSYSCLEKGLLSSNPDPRQVPQASQSTSPEPAAPARQQE